MTRLILLSVLLSGCTPFVGYTHLSMPNVDDEGYDFACVGAEVAKGRFRGDVSLCENLARNQTDTFAKIEGRILLGDLK